MDRISTLEHFWQSISLQDYSVPVIFLFQATKFALCIFSSKSTLLSLNYHILVLHCFGPARFLLPYDFYWYNNFGHVSSRIFKTCQNILNAFFSVLSKARSSAYILSQIKLLVIWSTFEILAIFCKFSVSCTYLVRTVTSLPHIY
jgi:hypothetical protein